MNLFSLLHDPRDCPVCGHRFRGKRFSAWVMIGCTGVFLILLLVATIFAESPTQINQEKLARQGEVVLSLEEAYDLASVQVVWLKVQGQMSQAENRLRELDKFMLQLKPAHDEALAQWQGKLREVTEKYGIEVDEFTDFVLAEKKLKGTKKAETAVSEKKEESKK